jgi:hypothetical protein
VASRAGQRQFSRREWRINRYGSTQFVKFGQSPEPAGNLRSKKPLLFMLENIGRTIADKAGSDERTLTVSVAAVGVSVVVASVFVWAL